jgi:hypothetical protein
MAQVQLETVPDETIITATESRVETIQCNTCSKKRHQEEVQTSDPDDETTVVAIASIIPELHKEILDSRRRQKNQQAEMIVDKSRKLNGLAYYQAPHNT